LLSFGSTPTLESIRLTDLIRGVGYKHKAELLDGFDERRNDILHWAYRMPDGVNGVMRANGILRFNDMIDM
jgi:hypothetical protein